MSTLELQYFSRAWKKNYQNLNYKTNNHGEKCQILAEILSWAALIEYINLPKESNSVSYIPLSHRVISGDYSNLMPKSIQH